MMQLIPAELKDAAEILALQKSAYLSEAAIYQDYEIAPLQQTLIELESDFSDHLILKAVLDGRIIGSVRALTREGTGYIGRLVVHPDFQNRGIGTLLIREIETRLSPVKRFELFTGHKSERNLRLYGKLGYSVFRREVVNSRLTQVYLEK